MVEYRFHYKFLADAFPSEFGATFATDADAIKWWDGFSQQRGEAVHSIEITRRDGDRWQAVRMPVS